MTYDKQNNGQTAKPFTPTLSAAFSRAKKSPLTPKLATPSTVRGPKRLAPSDHPATTPSRQPSEPSYLNANVTPRSGSRTSRRDGPILSPGSTPANGIHSPQPFAQPSPGNGPNNRIYRTDRSPVRMGPKLEPPRNVRAKTLTAESNAPRPHSTTDSTASPRFFHASDARSVSSSSDADARSRVSTKSASPATFIYANGQEESQAPEDTNRRRSSGLTRPAIVSRPTTMPRIKSPNSNASSPRFSDTIPSSNPSQYDDPPDIRSPLYSPPLSSVRPVPMISHTKSASLDSARSTPVRETPGEGLRRSPLIVSGVDSQVEGNNVPDAIPALRPRIFSNGSTNSVDTDSQGDGLSSPVKSEHAGNSGPILNARVERKIMDLEISNSSLLAINRTLEREMRKQNAELRRFRRLSRSGRLSMAPSRSVSGTLSIPSEIDEDERSELSSNQSLDELSDLSDEDLTPDESSLDPGSTAEDDVQHRNKDEKRFLIDLAKHQELLADSQRMNQSLKRCLGFTEELIREAKNALEYNVHVSDVQLGGRVLSDDDLTEDREAGRGLLAVVSPETELPNIDPPDMDPPGEESPSPSI
ncbi:hypothetical protein BDV06DRAFT_184325 [Aspergillus oleicola]